MKAKYIWKYVVSNKSKHTHITIEKLIIGELMTLNIYINNWIFYQNLTLKFEFFLLYPVSTTISTWHDYLVDINKFNISKDNTWFFSLYICSSHIMPYPLIGS